ncbi:MAG: gamma-glutamyl-gamma-aminobutyrate hydrolase family protein [Peptococcaceae bacterium]|nr:gamma-glutamyl-gamma-aminobutyrate hydrolase family protein [Peptococcaceae bacterium]
MKPLIGITCAWDEDKDMICLGGMYVKAVQAGGGVPLPLACDADEDFVDRISGAIDGLILSGGPDVDPFFFGEEPLPESREICPRRDASETALARRALAANIPVLGICRGMQVLNIAAGGDIYQDIHSQLNDRLIKHFQQAPRWHPTHEILIRQGTVMASILGPGAVRVNSFHHQAVRKVADGFIVSAQSADGVIEAVEAPGLRFALGIQCHPETLWERRPLFLNLFKRLVEAARKGAG